MQGPEVTAPGAPTLDRRSGPGKVCLGDLPAFQAVLDEVVDRGTDRDRGQENGNRRVLSVPSTHLRPRLPVLKPRPARARALPRLTDPEDPEPPPRDARREIAVLPSLFLTFFCHPVGIARTWDRLRVLTGRHRPQLLVFLPWGLLHLRLLAVLLVCVASWPCALRCFFNFLLLAGSALACCL